MADVSKFFTLYNCLLSHELVSASYLSKKLGISVRSVYRYIEMLDPVVPVEVVRGKYGGFKLMDSYTVSKNCFTSDEFRTLVSLLDGVDVGSKETIDSIRNKLFSVHKEKYETYSVMSDSLIIDGSAWGAENGIMDKVALIQQAISENKLLLIRYQDREGDVEERQIEPHVVILKQGFWYVYAFCRLRNDFRLFKVSRIKSTSLENETFERKPVDKKRLSFDKWFKSVSTTTVDFLLTDKIRPEIEEWLGVENVYETPSGEIMATAKLPENLELYGKILSFGQDITIVSPPKLKEKLGELAIQIAKKYT